MQLVFAIAAVAGFVGVCVAWRSRSLAAGQVLILLPEIGAIAIFALTYLVIAIGRLPGLGLDRAGAALVGASLMVAAGALPLEEAPKAIDFDTIILLLGVMIVVANLRLSGFFALVSDWVVARARNRSCCSSPLSRSREPCPLFS